MNISTDFVLYYDKVMNHERADKGPKSAGEHTISMSMSFSVMSILQHNALDVSKDYCQIIPVHIPNDSLQMCRSFYARLRLQCSLAFCRVM